jgi:hypothetical protein
MVRIGFHSRKGLWPWLVSKVTGSKWVHTWVEYESKDWGGRWIMHASLKGVFTLPAEQVESGKDIEEVSIFESLTDIRPALESCSIFVGRKYDIWTLLWNMVLLLLYKASGAELGKKARNPGRFTCSEFVTLVLQRGNLHEVKYLTAEFVKPGELWDILENSPSFRRINADRP